MFKFSETNHVHKIFIPTASACLWFMVRWDREWNFSEEGGRERKQEVGISFGGIWHGLGGEGGNKCCQRGKEETELQNFRTRT